MDTDGNGQAPHFSPVTELRWLVVSLSRVNQLSPAQRQVLGCIASGLDVRSTARFLGRSERTVKAHTSEIMIRLKIDSRLKAGIIGYHLMVNGWLEPPKSTTSESASCLL
jgi:DNA-binding NarL/FixJ family response regulator